jgi:hypothetical protein
MTLLFLPGYLCRSEIWEESSTYLSDLDIQLLDWT